MMQTKRNYPIVCLFLSCILCNSSSYAANWMFESVSNAVDNVGKFLDEVVQGIDVIVDKVKRFDNIISDAVEEECEYECPSGGKPVPNRSYVSVPNGCGSLGMEWRQESLPVEQLSKCCDKHDMCYDTCNENKEHCDKMFKKCLYDICGVYKQLGDLVVKKCKMAAKFMYTGTLALGCKAFRDAQSQACICPKKQQSDL